MVGVGVHGETIVTSKPEPEEQLDVAVNYLSMLAAALHFTAAAVAFAVLVVAVSANKTSTKRLVARLDRIDGAFEEDEEGGARTVRERGSSENPRRRRIARRAREPTRGTARKKTRRRPVGDTPCPRGRDRDRDPPRRLRRERRRTCDAGPSRFG